MMLNTITPSVDQKYWLLRLEITNLNSIKIPKVLKTTNKKTLGTSVCILQSNVPFLPEYLIFQGSYRIYSITYTTSVWPEREGTMGSFINTFSYSLA